MDNSIQGQGRPIYPFGVANAFHDEHSRPKANKPRRIVRAFIIGMLIPVAAALIAFASFGLSFIIMSSTKLFG